ncbi:complement factor H [Erinaceus europaeus]|uniref:Complement factor H n=1 Tax=Erinaceus europaeus TaxID=9365 RepID=A0A1S3ASP8_ERIEU|nr:complement factor H [Erinaceus europaeus]
MRFPGIVVWLMFWTACVAQDCNEAPPRKDSEILSGSWPEKSYSEGTKATYKCRPGYRTLGTIIMICRNGKWESLYPSRICQKKPCGHPGDTAFGSFHLAEGTKFEYGAKVVYTCNEGYQLLGEVDYRECEPEGWTNDIPKCEVVKCLPVTEPENGRIAGGSLGPDQEYTFGQVVRFECNSGLMLKGPKEIHCSTNGVWSDGSPECVEISCEVPGIVNGIAISQKKFYRNNERLQYKCNKGFEYSERGDAVCTSFGWSPVPACKEVTCTPPYIPNGFYEPQKHKYRTEDTVTYECKDGFFPTTQGTTVKCTITGWVPAPRCGLKPCDFPEIKHGRLYEEGYYRPYFPAPIGKSYYYHCDENFEPPTQTYWGQISCTKEGWKPKLLCRRKCILDYLAHGQIQQWKRKYYQGETARVTCHSGYSLENGQSIVTCTENDWVPPAKCLPVKTCLKSKLDIENGFLSESAPVYYVNKETTYKCKPGYVTEHGNTSGKISCLEHGWSATPACIKSCVKPVFTNARGKNVSTWFKLNDKVEYECYSGYESKTGSTRGSIVCGDNGWSDQPICYERECQIPKIDRYLSVNPRIEKQKVGSVVKFSCRDNRKRVGPDSSQCYHFGWSPQFPKCKEQVESCVPPPELPNGEVKGLLQGTYEHSDVVEYVCKPRFLMKGSDKIQCVDGEWTALPQCIEEKRTCGDVPELDHGYAEPSDPPYHHGDSINVTCEDGYTMVGDRSLTCNRGLWTQLPKCIATNELLDCKPSNVLTSPPPQSSYSHNFKLNYKCRGKSENKQSTCINGNWEPEINCMEVQTQPCAPPPQIPNAEAMTTTVNYQDGQKISILCQENYLIQDTEEITCKNGKWQSLPHCVEKVSCPQPPPVQNGQIALEKTFEQELYPHGTKLSYICEEGFRISNDDGITCHMGVWSSPPQCTGLPCAPPPEISHGVLSEKADSYHFGDQFTYSCVEGYGINGDPSITCLGAKWSSLPECINTDCSQLPSFDIAKPKGHTKNVYHSGEQVSYACPEFHQMDGSNIVQCINGNWTGNPTCRDVSCKNPPRVENAILPEKVSRYQSGERVRYECKKPFDLFGSIEVMCLNGTWTNPPQCKDSKGKCGTPPPIDNGDITSSPVPVYAPGSTVEYQCQNLYKLEGRAIVRCYNGEWSKPPRCLEPCVISEDIMNKHKIQLRWIDRNKLYSQSGEPVEFSCKHRYRWISPEPLRTKCVEGRIAYPTCG